AATYQELAPRHAAVAFFRRLGPDEVRIRVIAAPELIRVTQLIRVLLRIEPEISELTQLKLSFPLAPRGTRLAQGRPVRTGIAESRCVVTPDRGLRVYNPPGSESNEAGGRVALGAPHVDVAGAKRCRGAGLRVVGMAPDAAGVIGQQVDRDRRLRRGRPHPVDVVARWDERVEVARAQGPGLGEPNRSGARLVGL